MFNANSETFKYAYNANGERIRKVNLETSEGDYYLRDYLGRELIIYDNLTNEPKSANIYGNGLVGKIEVNGTTDSRSYHGGKLRVHEKPIRDGTATQGVPHTLGQKKTEGRTLRPPVLSSDR